MTRPKILFACFLLEAIGCERFSTSTASAGGSWACPMHPQVTGDKAQPCPICGMKLELRHGGGAYLCPQDAGTGAEGAVGVAPGKCKVCGRALQPATAILTYDCPSHRDLALTEASSCPICGKALLPRTMARVWKCLEHPEAAQVAEGACPRCGKAMGTTFVDLPHGDHNPKHGGVFFMAPDLWHHIEGVLSDEKTFRLFVYDNFTRPLKLEGIAAHFQEWKASSGGEALLDPQKVALLAAGNGEYLEAKREGSRLPAHLTLFVVFDLARVESSKPREPCRFDFSFEKTASEPGDDAPAWLQAAPRLEIPADSRQLEKELERRAQRVQELVSRRALTSLYVPALEAKDLALSLLERKEAVPAEERPALERAAAAIVRGAWLLDLHGDMGDFEKVKEAHKVFQEGVDEIDRLLRGRR